MKGKVSCAIYTRVSTDNQAEVEFNSCEAQKEKILHFIKSQDGFKVYDYFNDEGFSGKDLNRPAFQRMIAEVERGKVNCIITYKMDRLTRSPRDFYQLIELFDKHKVDFISVTERFDTSTPSGRLLRNIMLTFAQFERELASERTKDKLLQRAGKGMWNGGTVPYGYEAVDKKLIINEDEAKIVRFIYDKYIKSGSLACVYNLLKKQKYYHRTGNVFLKSVLSGILRNIVYTGKMKYNGKIYEGIHEAVIAQETYDLAQKKHKEAPTGLRRYREFLFGGLVRCGECGSVMTPSHVIKTRNGTRTRYYYYRCTCTYKKDWQSCSIKQINADKLEGYVFDNLKRISMDKIYIDNLMFRRIYQDNKSSSPEANRFSQGYHIGLEPDGFCLEELTDKFRRSLNFLIKAAEKNKDTNRCHSIKKYINNILFSKETIEVTIHWDSAKQEEEGILKQTGEKSAANTQMECAKPMKGNRVGQTRNGLKYMENAGTVADEPRRSDKIGGAEGLSAEDPMKIGTKAEMRPKGADTPSEARSAERGARKLKRARPDITRPDSSRFRWLQSTIHI